MVSLLDAWFSNITYFLTYGDCLKGLTYKKIRDLKINTARFVIYDQLYKKVIDGIFLRCVDRPQQERFHQAFHSEACGGHFSPMDTRYNIFR